MARLGRLEGLLPYVLVSVSYYVGARVGLALTPAPNPVSTLWPPNAILLAALLCTDRRKWPMILAAALPAHLIVELGGGIPMGMVLSWFVSNCAEALIGALFIHRAAGAGGELDNTRQLGAFVVGGAVIAPFLSSFLDAGFVLLNGFGTLGFWDVWRIRFFSNVLAILTIVPVILAIAPRVRRSRWRRVRPARMLEAIALTGWLAAACAFLYLRPPDAEPMGPALFYVPLPLLLWALVRFGPTGASASLLGITLVSVWGAVHGKGPFAATDGTNHVLSLQVYLILTSVPMLALSALVRERRSAEEAAQRNAEQLQLALDAADMGAWDLDLSTDRLVLSNDWRRMLGTAPGETADTGEKMTMMIHPADRPTVAAAVDDAVTHGRECDVEFRMYRADGSIMWLHARGKVLPGEDGRPQRVVGVSADVTARRRAENDAAIQRRELVHLGRVAVLGELSGALAHELNQPLAAILANARAAQRMLERGGADREELLEILDDIVSDDLRAGAVVHRVRRMIRKGGVDPQPLVANEVVHEVLDLAHSDLVHRAVAVRTQLAVPLPPVAADRVQLQQVMLNLILNACDAMAENEPSQRHLTITTAGDPDSVHMSVSDSGPGLPPDGIMSVFEPFVTSKTNGLGLGLAICRTIVHAHGGKIWAANNADRGATFHLSLPRSAH
jgi:two-component system sensor kinase FixL